MFHFDVLRNIWFYASQEENRTQNRHVANLYVGLKREKFTAYLSARAIRSHQKRKTKS
jgi:hypothetical protein